jgi:hypothetical protein
VQWLASLLEDFMRQLGSVLSDLADFAVYVFDPNSGAWPKIVAGGLFTLLVLFIVTRASKAK